MTKRFHSIEQTLDYLFFRIALFLAVMLTIFTLVSYFFQMQRTAHEEAQNLAKKSESIMQINLDMLYHSFIFNFGTEEFSAELWNMVHDEIPYGQMRYLFQNELNAFSQQNSMLLSAVVYNPTNKRCYSLYKERILTDFEEILSPEDLQNIKGITWFTNRKTPFVSRDPVLYLVFPLKSGTIASLTDKPNDADAYIVAFINDHLLQEALSPTDDEQNAHTLFLFTNEGRLLKGIGKNQDTIRVIHKIQSKLTQTDFEDFSSIITNGSIPNKAVHVVVYTDKGKIFLSLLSEIAIIYVGILLVIAFIMFGAHLFLRKNIIRPLQTVMFGIERIKQGDLSHRIQIQNNDEIGLLSESVNQMSNRISEQMQAIQEKEEQQYKTELRLLTEQLNPHFIYNTLEYIRQSIITHSDVNAEKMIWHLSRYLRSTLAQGKDIVPISNEMKHVSSYVAIMENRFANHITLVFNGSIGTEKCLVLKTMLQPIVENSIKYGFCIDSNGLTIYNPMIEINFSHDNDHITIEICDNGKGFDVERVMGIMQGKIETGKHFGLPHTFSRIQHYYGMDKAKIELSSEPYYRNMFRLIVPYIGIDEKN